MSLIQLSGAQDLLQLSPCSLNYPLTLLPHPPSPLQPAATVRRTPRHPFSPPPRVLSWGLPQRSEPQIKRLKWVRSWVPQIWYFQLIIVSRVSHHAIANTVLDAKANRGSVQSGDEEHNPKNLVNYLQMHCWQVSSPSASSLCLKVALCVHFVPQHPFSVLPGACWEIPTRCCYNDTITWLFLMNIRTSHWLYTPEEKSYHSQLV